MIPNGFFGAVPTSDDGIKALVATTEAKATREAVENFIVDFSINCGGGEKVVLWKRSSFEKIGMNV